MDGPISINNFSDCLCIQHYQQLGDDYKNIFSCGVLDCLALPAVSDIIILESWEYGRSTKQPVKQHRACIESYISKDKRRIGLHAQSDDTKIQSAKRNSNPQRRITWNPVYIQLGILWVTPAHREDKGLFYNRKVFLIKIDSCITKYTIFKCFR